MSSMIRLAEYCECLRRQEHARNAFFGYGDESGTISVLVGRDELDKIIVTSYAQPYRSTNAIGAKIKCVDVLGVTFWDFIGDDE